MTTLPIEPNATNISILLMGKGWASVRRQWTAAELTPRRLRAAIALLRRNNIEVPAEMLAAAENPPSRTKSPDDRDFKVTSNGRASIPVSELLDVAAGRSVRVTAHKQKDGEVYLIIKPATPLHR